MPHNLHLTEQDIANHQAVRYVCDSCGQVEIWSMEEYRSRHGVCRTNPRLSLNARGECPTCPATHGTSRAGAFRPAKADETRWTCKGSVRGSCGIKHRSRGAAERCCDKDGRDCDAGSPGSYSDRKPCKVRRG
jgi:hypothetical protein